MNREQLFDYAQSILKQSEEDGHIDTGVCVEFLEKFVKSYGTSTSAILISGNPVDGLEFVGPFEDLETANNYADDTREFRIADWWGAEVTKPNLEKL